MDSTGDASRISNVMSAWGLSNGGQNKVPQAPARRLSAPVEQKLGSERSVTSSQSDAPAISAGSLERLLSKIEGLPEALTSATDTLVKQTSQAETRMKEILERFDRDRAAQLDNHVDKQMDELSRSFEEMKAAFHMFHEDWSKQWKEAEKDALKSPGVQFADDDGVIIDRRESRPRTPEALQSDRALATQTDTLRQSIDYLRSKSDFPDKHVKPVHEQVKKAVLQAYSVPSIWSSFAYRPRTQLAKIVDGDAFNAVCSLFIVANTIILGCQTNIDVSRAMKQERVSEPGWFRPINLMFMIFFTIELFIRIVAEKLYFIFGDHCIWNAFDTVMVFISLLEEITRDIGGNVSFFRVLKIIKMGRALRILRVFRYSRELRIMVCSIMASFVSLAWAFLLLLIIMYCTSVFICQGVVEYMEDHRLEDMVREWKGPLDSGMHPMEEYFGSLSKALYSHTLAISGGQDWVNIAAPIKDIGAFYLGVFIFYVVFVVFGMLNVLTGVFVDRATEQGHLDRDLVVESEKRKMEELCLALKSIFQEADTDESGNICWPEFQEYCKRDDVVNYLRSLQLELSETRELFRMLDFQESGSVNIEDFIYGCMRVKGVAKSLDLLHIQEDVLKVKKLLMVIAEQVEAMGDWMAVTHAEQSV